MMKLRVTNFGRFYTAIRALGKIGDRDEVKEALVRQYTNGRTASLREMTFREYNRCCKDLEQQTSDREALRKERSVTLRLLQKLGVDTTDWNRVNRFCEDKRIAGKEFAKISIEELRGLRTKLRAIERKGGICEKTESTRSGTSVTGKADTKIVVVSTANIRGEA